MAAVDPRVGLPRVEGRERQAPEVHAYRDAVQELHHELRAQLDRLGVPRELGGERLTFAGRVSVLLEMFELEARS